MNLKEIMKEKLDTKELKHLKRSQDIIGDIAIIEIPDELKEKEKLIANALLESKPYLKTVLKKGKHSGEYRTQELKYLAGENTKEALYKENNVVMKLDVEQVYFSPRLSTERKRISGMVKKGETVLVMFSGCFPYGCAIAKNTRAKEVIGVEINPRAHYYAEQNIKLNNLKNCFVYCGDAGQIVPRLGGKFDRIVMPAPHNASQYLSAAMGAVKKPGVIHYYDFCQESEFGALRKQIKEKLGKSRILRLVKAGQVSPGEYRVCLDIKVS